MPSWNAAHTAWAFGTSHVFFFVHSQLYPSPCNLQLARETVLGRQEARRRSTLRPYVSWFAMHLEPGSGLHCYEEDPAASKIPNGQLHPLANA